MSSLPNIIEAAVELARQTLLFVVGENNQKSDQQPANTQTRKPSNP